MSPSSRSDGDVTDNNITGELSSGNESLPDAYVDDDDEQDFKNCLEFPQESEATQAGLSRSSLQSTTAGATCLSSSTASSLIFAPLSNISSLFSTTLSTYRSNSESSRISNHTAAPRPSAQPEPRDSPAERPTEGVRDDAGTLESSPPSSSGALPSDDNSGTATYTSSGWSSWIPSCISKYTSTPAPSTAPDSSSIISNPAKKTKTKSTFSSCIDFTLTVAACAVFADVMFQASATQGLVGRSEIGADTELGSAAIGAVTSLWHAGRWVVGACMSEG